jgi:hypothetical protein
MLGLKALDLGRCAVVGPTKRTGWAPIKAA